MTRKKDMTRITPTQILLSGFPSSLHVQMSKYETNKQHDVSTKQFLKRGYSNTLCVRVLVSTEHCRSRVGYILDRANVLKINSTC